MSARRWLAAALCVCVAPAMAQWQRWDSEFDDEQKTWKELETRIPPYPRPENLVRVDVGSATAHQFFVDAASVSSGEDGVMRYTILIKASGGATNVAFEGMRCQTRERKVYALGRTDGTWTRAADTKWQRIVPRDFAPYRFVLYREFFCPNPLRPPTAKQAVDTLRRGGPPAPPVDF